jgi:hypothetical protein
MSSPTTSPHHEQYDRRLHVVAAVDREPVVRTGEEEVEAERRDDRGNGPTPATTHDRNREDREHENERRVRREELVSEGDQDPRQCERAGERHHPADDADFPLGPPGPPQRHDFL